MNIVFLGLEDHNATLYKSGYVKCSCGKVLDKVAGEQGAYEVLERHIRIKLGYKGSLVRGPQ